MVAGEGEGVLRCQFSVDSFGEEEKLTQRTRKARRRKTRADSHQSTADSKEKKTQDPPSKNEDGAPDKEKPKSPCATSPRGAPEDIEEGFLAPRTPFGMAEGRGRAILLGGNLGALI